MSLIRQELVSYRTMILAIIILVKINLEKLVLLQLRPSYGIHSVLFYKWNNRYYVENHAVVSYLCG